jgi:outer membrane protein OmpA-like peptidoglycan-associated protein
MALAADAPFMVKRVGLQPMLEYHLEASVGSGDQVVQQALANAVMGDRLSGRTAQYLTLGLRARPAAGLVLDLGLDVGLQSAGFQFGAPVPGWNLMAGVQYAYDPHAAKMRSVTKTVTREITREPLVGRVRGVVRDANTKQPIRDAIVKYVDRRETPQSSAEDGTFVSYGFPPGPVRIEVSRDDYEPATKDASTTGKGETPVEVLLVPKPPAAGTVRGRVADAGGLPIGAAVRLTSSTGAIVDAEIEGVGVFNARLPNGDYSLEVLADGYLARQRTLTVAAGQLQSLDLVLAKKPAVSHVTLATDEIRLKGTIHFGTDNSDIRPDSQQLLDEVADVLIRNPQIKKLRIEGHTDGRGDAAMNMTLSKARANTVAAYLIRLGIDSSRIESEGYGSLQPLVPSLSASNRARNRRVAFKILETTPPTSTN